MFKYLSLFLLSVFLLTACQSNYRVEVDLTSEEEQSLLQAIEENQSEIEERNLNNEQTSLQTVNIARAYESLGQLDKAIETYENYLKEKTHSSIIYNNVARLYEQVGKYNKAIEQYEILIDQFYDVKYFKNIALIQLKKEKPQEAQKSLDQWEEATGQTDDFTQKRIDKMLNE